ncbi:MAG: glycoside hydrolase family 18 protein [Sumerlaeia bacterium]
MTRPFRFLPGAFRAIFFLISGTALFAAPEPGHSPPARAALPAEATLAEAAPPDPALKGAIANSAVRPVIDPRYIVFGYHPSYRDGIEFHYRWHALTHIGYAFVDFTDSGALQTASWDGRPSAFKAGGSAEANGVKVHMVLRNDNFLEPVLDTVMRSPALRQTVIANVIAAISADSYVQGISLDLEFDWEAETRDGITLFVRDLRAALDAWTAADPANRPRMELNYYMSPTFSSRRYDIPGLIGHLDHVILSCYPWAGGFSTRVGAVADRRFFVREGNDYINAGVPHPKLVLALPLYGFRWETDSPVYGATIPDRDAPANGAVGFKDALYATTLGLSFGGPLTRNFEEAPEVAWYTYSIGGVPRVVTFDDDRALESKIALARDWEDPDGSNGGRPVGGVAFWEMYWIATEDSYDPIGQQVVERTRTYPHVYQFCAEILSPPGTTKFPIARFEGNNPDFRWRDPDESPDTRGTAPNATSRSLAPAPGAPGAPPESTIGMAVDYAFAGFDGGRAFFRHEILADDGDTGVLDRWAAAALVTADTQFEVFVHASLTAVADTVRFVVMDDDLQLEMSPPLRLQAGWQVLSWDMAERVLPYNTSEPLYRDGDGAIDTRGGRDIAFLGFLIERNTMGSPARVVFDELVYTASDGAQDSGAWMLY